MVNIHVNDNNNQIRINVPGINNTVTTESSNPNNNVSSTIGNETFYNGLAKEWAISPDLVQGIDYSAKYYAQKAKVSEDIASNAITNIEAIKEQAITEITSIGDDYEINFTALTVRAENASNQANTYMLGAKEYFEQTEECKDLVYGYTQEAQTLYDNTVSAANNARNSATSANNAMSTVVASTRAAQRAQELAERARDNASESARNAFNYADEAQQAKIQIEQELTNYVPNTRKINDKPLTGDITLTSTDVGALSDSTKYGKSIAYSLDSTTYILTLSLKDQDGTVLNSINIDLPLESYILNLEYDNSTKELVITYQSGNSIRVPIGAIIGGLQSEITSTNMLNSDLVDDASSVHKFATAEQLSQISTNANNIQNINNSLTNYITTNTAQDISGRKTFLGEKAIYFKQVTTSNKLGFTLYNPSNTELAALEYRPNTINGASLLALNCPQTTGGYVGFRYWGTPAVNIIAPKVATAGNYYIPINITNGTTTVTANNVGTVNISTLLPDVSNFVTNTSLATTLQDYVLSSDLSTTLTNYVTNSDLSTTLSNYATKNYVDTGLATKQATLVSGTNIKTINGNSLLGSGNITIEGGGGGVSMNYDSATETLIFS